MIAVLVPTTLSAVVDRIEDEAFAVLEVSCVLPPRRHPAAPVEAFSTMGRRGDIPPPQRLPPVPRTGARRGHATAVEPGEHRALPGDARIPPTRLVYLDVNLSQLPAGLREGDFVPLTALALHAPDVCSGDPLPHGAGGGPARRPDTPRAHTLAGMP